MPVYTPPLTTYATGWDWIERVRAHTRARDQRALLASGIDADVTTFNVAHAPTFLSAQSRISCGLETMYVWSYNSSTGVVEVQRGVDGSTAAPHLAGDTTFVNPRWSTYEIWLALVEEVISLPSAGLWCVSEIERTWDSLIQGVDLVEDLVGDRVLAVMRQGAGDGRKNWSRLWDWDITQNAPTGDYSSGKALMAVSGVATGDILRIVYRSQPGVLADPDLDPVAQTNLAYSAGDIPPIGAAIRLLVNQPVMRTNTNSSPTARNPGEVSAGDAIQSAAPLRNLKQTRIAEEVTLQQASYPVNQKVRRF